MTARIVAPYVIVMTPLRGSPYVALCCKRALSAHAILAKWGGRGRVLDRRTTKETLNWTKP